MDSELPTDFGKHQGKHPSGDAKQVSATCRTPLLPFYSSRQVRVIGYEQSLLVSTLLVRLLAVPELLIMFEQLNTVQLPIQQGSFIVS